MGSIIGRRRATSRREDFIYAKSDGPDATVIQLSPQHPSPQLLECQSSILKAWLVFQDSLQLEIDSVNTQIADLELQVKSIETELEALRQELATALDRLDFLDKKELEELQVTGDHERYHIFGTRRWTPPFHFELSTNFPIRNVIADIPASSRWVDLPQYLDHAHSTQFRATLLNKKLVSARAKVQLEGWRKEIHAAEITEIKALVEAKMEDEPTLLEKLEALRKSMVHMQLRRTVYKAEFDQSLQFSSHTSDPDLLQAQLEIQSIYGIACSYELTARVRTTYTLPASLSVKLHNPLPRRLFQLEWCMKEDLSRYLRKTSRSLSEQVQRMSEDSEYFRGAAKTAFDGRTCFNVEKVKSDAASDLKHTRSVATPAYTRLLELENTFSSILQVQIESFEELASLSHETDALIAAEATMQVMLQETQADIDASKKTVAILDQEVWPIGAFAAFVAEDSALDAWVNVWEAARTELYHQSVKRGGITLASSIHNEDTERGSL